MEYRDVARDSAARTRAIVGERTQVCIEQQAAVARLQTLAQRGSVSLQYEDDQAGTRAEQLRCAVAALRESQQQLEAAQAELAAAQRRIKKPTETP